MCCRESVEWLARQLMEVEVSEWIGAEHGERRPADRATHRNGYRPRRWDTRAGETELPIPKLRQGSYFPSFLRPRKRSEQALLSVVQQAYVCGVSTRRVDQLFESLGLRVSRSEVSRICAGLDEQVEAFRTRPLEGRYLYLFLDAKVEKVRDGGRVQRKCVVIAHGVHDTGRREIIGLDVGAAETETFWTEFVRSLVARGLVGVQLVISDAHEGLKNAIAKVLGAPAALHRALPQRLPRPRPPRSARAAGGADPPDLQRREPRRRPRPALRGGRHAGGHERRGEAEGGMEGAGHGPIVGLCPVPGQGP
jgi:putative transposase